MSAQVQGAQAKTLRLLSHKEGATVEQIAKANGFKSTKQSRGHVDRLRAKGIKIVNNGPHRFKATIRNKRSG